MPHMVKPLGELVHPSWVPVLEPVSDVVREMGDRLRAEVAAGRGYLPAGDNILRAFSTPLGEVRVLILGQDPYPTRGHPIGLCFAVAKGVWPLPKSLQNICLELRDDVGVPLPSHGDLSRWTDQGVMLLNRVLTVRPGKSQAHKGWGWEKVTDAAVTALAARDAPLVSILWGRDAQSARRLLGDTACIESVHPSPLSAHRGFFGSRPFSRANALLTGQGGQPVDWTIDENARAPQ